MFSVLYKTDQPTEGLVRFNHLEQLYRYYKRDLNSVYEYYRQREARVNSNHILSRIINAFNANIHMDIFSFITSVDEIKPFIARHFKITCNDHPMEVLHQPIIAHTDSILVDIDEGIDYFNVKEYKELVPVKPFMYTGSGLEMNHPSNYDEVGLILVAYGIDLKLLMVMYRAWAKERMLSDKTIDPSIFVYQYVLTNMIGRIMDISILNRAFYSDYKGFYKGKHPFLILDKSANMDKELNKMYVILEKKKMDPYNFLMSIPLLSTNNVYDLYHLPYQFYNNNKKYGLFLLFIIPLAIFFKTTGRYGYRKSPNTRYELNTILRSIRSKEVAAINNVLILEMLDNLKKLIGVKK